MIRNIVFDVGNVLLSFKPREYLSNKFFDAKTANHLHREIFCSREWVELDRGTMQSKEAFYQIKARNAMYDSHINEVMNSWMDILKPINGTIDIVKQLKRSKKYNLYILSNYHLEAFEKASTDNEFFRLFDGMVVSSHIKKLKPEPDIYRHLLNKYSLDPSETLFIDDTPENLEGAKAFGIKTIRFTTPDALFAELKKTKIL